MIKSPKAAKALASAIGHTKAQSHQTNTSRDQTPNRGRLPQRDKDLEGIDWMGQWARHNMIPALGWPESQSHHNLMDFHGHFRARQAQHTVIEQSESAASRAMSGSRRMPVASGSNSVDYAPPGEKSGAGLRSVSYVPGPKDGRRSCRLLRYINPYEEDFPIQVGGVTNQEST